MYLPGQIIHSFDSGEPICIGDNVWKVEAYPTRHTHYICEAKRKKSVLDQPCPGYEVFTPKSVEQAKTLLSVGIIAPAPAAISTHCWRCGNWHDNCRAFGCLEGKGRK